MKDPSIRTGLFARRYKGRTSTVGTVNCSLAIDMLAYVPVVRLRDMSPVSIWSRLIFFFLVRTVQLYCPTFYLGQVPRI